MIALSSILSLAAPIAVAIMLVVMGLLSRRLGAVTRRPPVYRWYYVGAMLVIMGIVLRLWSMDRTGRLLGHMALLYLVPLVVGLAIAAVVTWRYWGWLIYEQEDRR